MTATRRAFVASVAGLAAGWLAMALLVWIYGDSPRAVARDLLAGTWGVPYGVGQVLYKATPLLFAGLGVDLALRAGLFNIGSEGQLAVAGLAVGSLGARLPVGTPGVVAIPVLVLVSMLAGALWSAPPAVLRARYGAHEVISSIMMNCIATALVGFALVRGLAVPATVRTPDVVPGALLPRLDALGLHALHGSAANLALVLGVVSAFAVAWWLRSSRVGREIVLVGLSPTACAAEHIPVPRRLAEAFVLSGALSGMAAIGPVLGYKGYFESGLGAGAGFGGIAVALLGRGHPVGLLLAALLFGTLEQGGLAINGRVPMEITTVLQGVVIAAVAVADARVRRAALAR